MFCLQVMFLQTQMAIRNKAYRLFIPGPLFYWLYLTFHCNTRAQAPFLDLNPSLRTHKAIPLLTFSLFILQFP